MNLYTFDFVRAWLPHLFFDFLFLCGAWQVGADADDGEMRVRVTETEYMVSFKYHI